MNRNRCYVKSPKIPGYVYKGLSNTQEALMCFIIGIVLLMIHDINYFIKIAFSFFMLFLSFLTWKVFPEKPKSVYIDPTRVKADFGDGRIISDDLANYDLYIGISQSRGGFHSYSYNIGLFPKENAKLGKKALSKTSSLKNTIPIRFRIFTPKNLKEYTESFQNQIDHPMNIIFESEKTMEEYKSGEFIKPQGWSRLLP